LAADLVCIAGMPTVVMGVGLATVSGLAVIAGAFMPTPTAMLTAVIAIFVLMVFVMFVVTVVTLIAPVVMRKAMIRSVPPLSDGAVTTGDETGMIKEKMLPRPEQATSFPAPVNRVSFLLSLFSWPEQ
jgi:hypothetical protein